MTGAEDWDLGLRTIAAGPRIRIKAKIVHDEGRVRFLNICWKKAYYAPGVALFIRKHGVKGVVAMSSRPWLRQPRALLKPLGIGLLLLKIGQAVSMAAGMSWVSFGRAVGLPNRPTSRVRGRGTAS
jgi:hypothetical protein